MIYWTRLGAEFPRRWSEQRYAVFEQNMRGIIPMACWCGFPPTTLMPRRPFWIALPPTFMRPPAGCSGACWRDGSDTDDDTLFKLFEETDLAQ